MNDDKTPEPDESDSGLRGFKPLKASLRPVDLEKLPAECPRCGRQTFVAGQGCSFCGQRG